MVYIHPEYEHTDHLSINKLIKSFLEEKQKIYIEIPINISKIYIQCLFSHADSLEFLS